MTRSLRLALAALALAAASAFALAPARAAENFPALTGRVVDQAQVLSSAERADLETKLADLESKSGIQLVVATVSSLDGEEIEPYANALFRAWKLGEAKKNNGVLFLVAPNQHRVRIEVGYGLEGTLTDATSSVIISNAVTPRFKAGDFNGGVARGVDDIITVLTTDSADWQKKPELRAETNAAFLDTFGPFLVFGIILFFFMFVATRAAAAAFSAVSSSARRCLGGTAARSAAAISAAAAASRGAADRRAAAAPRGAGDGDQPAATGEDRGGLRRRAAAHAARRSSACWRAPRPITSSCRCCGAGCSRSLTPWPLLIFTQLSAQRIFVAQLLVCFAASVILSLAPQRILLTPARVRRANAHRAALVQFSVRGLERAPERNGVLVYVSLAERYARVIAADAAAEAIAQSQWQKLVDALVADLRDRDATTALTGAAAGCAALLAPAFPAAAGGPPSLANISISCDARARGLRSRAIFSTTARRLPFAVRRARSDGNLRTMALTVISNPWLRSAVLIAALALASGAQAAGPTLVVDVDSGNALIANQATAPWYPASLTKLVTVYVALQAVKDGKLTMDTPLTMSEHAASMPASKMGFIPGTEVTLDNALKMLMVKSPNDVAVMVAESISGSVEAFADEMNATAARLGMHESHFVNPNGLHDPAHVSSARDMAIVARALLRDFPDHSDLFDIGALQLGNIIIANHNGLLGHYPGADGMKTGFTCPAGFNVVGTRDAGRPTADRRRARLADAGPAHDGGGASARSGLRHMGRRPRASRKPAGLGRDEPARHARRDLLAPQSRRRHRRRGGDPGAGDDHHDRARPGHDVGCARARADEFRGRRPAGSLRAGTDFCRPQAGLDRAGARRQAERQ